MTLELTIITVLGVAIMLKALFGRSSAEQLIPAVTMYLMVSMFLLAFT